MRVERIAPAGARRPASTGRRPHPRPARRRRALVEGPPADGGRPRGAVGASPARSGAASLDRPDRRRRGELHEDEAALRLAAAVAAAPGSTIRGPSESRVDLVAAVRRAWSTSASRTLERLNRHRPARGVHRLRRARSSSRATSWRASRSRRTSSEAVHRRRGERVARFGPRPLVWVAAVRPAPVGVLVKESIERPPARPVRGERPGQGRGARLADRRASSTSRRRRRGRGGAARRCTRGAGSRRPRPDRGRPAAPTRATRSSSRSTRSAGRLVRHGVPAHPGLDALAGAGRARRPILGLPTCGAYSKATAADLLLPRLPPASRRAGDRGPARPRRHPHPDQRFRFPPYARELDAPDG